MEDRREKNEGMQAGLWLTGLVVVIAVAIVVVRGLPTLLGAGEEFTDGEAGLDCRKPRYPDTEAPPGSAEWMDAMTKAPPSPDLEMVRPKNMELVDTARPAIVYKWNNWRQVEPLKVIFRVNGKDVSDRVVRKNCLFIYRPDEDIPQGHVLTKLVILPNTSGHIETDGHFEIYTENQPPPIRATYWGTTEHGKDYDRSKILVVFEKSFPPHFARSPRRWTVRNLHTGKTYRPEKVNQIADSTYILVFKKPFPKDLWIDAYDIVLSFEPPGSRKSGARERKKEPPQWPTMP
jgi:hypothetical protein